MLTRCKNVVFSREILYMAQKHGNSAAVQARKVLPFSVTNELGLENYLSYPCPKFGENRWKIAPASVHERENFVTAEVGRRACALKCD